LSISRIAWLLGYHETSAFTHAFRRWYGRTPRQVRAQILTAPLADRERIRDFGRQRSLR
jgi:AraC-like DNA-binding protein